MSRVEHLAEGVTLYLGDCRDILPTLGPVDAVITDPPYGINKASWDAVVPLEWFVAAKNAVGETGAVYVFGDAVTLSSFQVHWEQRGVQWSARIAWVYEDGPRNAAAWTSKHEDCLFYRGLNHKMQAPKEPSIHRDPRWGDDRLVGDVWKRPRILGNYGERSEHPTQKPIAVMQLPILASTKAGDVVCDPFMGSGSTGVAAVKLGRKFIGIDLEPTYFDIACKRISDALEQPDMFVAPPAKAVQEALL